ncbi:MAG: WecB/TagA/CpsF family glycosyltransferase [Pirellulales bacterium]|nr:WecB/TagA/CpsF family glycosyltransferase [Pirellulales bacterium]
MPSPETLTVPDPPRSNLEVPAEPLSADVETVEIWGLRLARVTTDETLDLVDRMIATGKPGFFITANLHYARLAAGDARLRRVNARAGFLVADGMPLVWYSRLRRRRLPERVTGADTIYRLCRRAAERGYRVFLLGGLPEVARQAAENLRRLWPELQIVGIETPMLSELSESEQAELIGRIRGAKADLLFAALGQPKGELWLAEHLDELGVPACVQIGASLDFVAGRVRRAPRWVQRIGAEWLWRIGQEPRRMIPRYTRDAIFLLRSVVADVLAGLWRKRSGAAG